MQSPNFYTRKNNIIAAILVGIILSSAVSLAILHSLQSQQYSHLISESRRQLESGLLSKASLISKVAARHIAEVEHATEIVASNAAADPTLTGENLKALLVSSVQLTNTINAMYIFDKDGILVYTTNPSPAVQTRVGESFSDHIAFVGAKNKKASFISPLTEAITADISDRIFISAPIVDPANAEFRGVVMSSMPSANLADSINHDVALEGEYSMALVDIKGDVAASSGPAGSRIGANIFSDEILGQVPESIRVGFANALNDALVGRTGVYTINVNDQGQVTTESISDVVMIGYTPVIVNDETVMVSFIVESANIQSLLRESENPAFAPTFVVSYIILIIMAIFAAVIIVINRKLSGKVTKSTLALEKNNLDLLTITAELVNKSSELEKANRARDEFSAMITHELKTPLVPIIAYCELLISGAQGKLPPQVTEKLNIIHESAKSLSRLISDLLDVRKLELGQLKLDFDAVPAREIVTKAVESAKPLADSKNVLLISYPEKTENGDGPLVIKGDQKRIEQVLNNLLSNAIKFAPEQNGVVQISLKRDNAYVAFTVEDNGIGIPADKVQNIFQKFYQVNTSSKRSAGSGLGLAICKGIVEGHGGKIWFESKINKGSTFYFSIPLFASETQAVEREKAPGANKE